jgi:hypothetical protein
MAELNESVEESGIGGVLRVSDMEFELFDVDGIFKDTIFDKANVTSCQAKILLNVDGTDYTVLYGDVDLSTIEYPSIYDDGAGNETYSVRFVVFSFLKRLEESTMETLYTNLVANQESVTFALTGNPVNCISFVNTLDQIQKLILPSGTFSTPTISVDWTATMQSGIGISNLGLLYFYLSGTTTPANPPKLWYDINSPESLRGLKDVKSFLIQMASELLTYPIFRYDPASDTFQLVLKQRAKETPIDFSGYLLKSSTLRSFYGYDGIRVTPKTQASATDYVILPSMSPVQFETLAQKYDFVHYFGTNDDVQEMNLFILNNSGGVDLVNNVMGGRWRDFLVSRFFSYWSNPSMYERTYVGTGIGGDYPVEILDRVTIDSVNYTITEIKRNLIDNELSIKAVEY